MYLNILTKYADSILDLIDKDYKIIKHRLYRNHTSIVGNGFVKVITLLIRDISKLGRDLSRVIIIDNLPENFRLQNNNGLAIKTWNEDMKDTQLSDFQKILTDIYVLKVPDVRNVIKRIREDLIKTKNNMNPYSSIDISKYL
jgi:CTD small phosphatase-like protein 2